MFGLLLADDFERVVILVENLVSSGLWRCPILLSQLISASFLASYTVTVYYNNKM